MTNTEMECEFKKLKEANNLNSRRVSLLEAKVNTLEEQEDVRERNYFNLTADERHIINKFLNGTTIAAAVESKKLRL